MTTTTTLIFDEVELSRVARAVIRFNSHAKGDEAQVVHSMKWHAHEALRDGGSYCSIGGYDLIRWVDGDGEVHIRAAVSSYLFT